MSNQRAARCDGDVVGGRIIALEATEDGGHRHLFNLVKGSCFSGSGFFCIAVALRMPEVR